MTERQDLQPSEPAMKTAILPRRLAALPALLTLVALASLACSGISFLAPTATPTPTETPTPTATFTLTATPTVTQTFTPSITPTVSYIDWPVVFSDSFDEDYGGWYTGVSKDEYDSANITISNGQYQLRITAIRPFIWLLPSPAGGFSDCFVSMDGEQSSGSRDIDFGIYFRASGGNYYYFAVSPAYQAYSILAYMNGELETVVEWRKSDTIHTAGANRLGVLAQEGQFAVFINDTKVDTFRNNSLKKGRVGIVIGMDKAGTYMSLAFDNFEVRAPG
jgi:hypothetical protein